MGGVGGAQRPVLRVNKPKRMGFAERPQPTSLLGLLSIYYVIIMLSMVQKIEVILLLY
jgi:hypothetical protein